MFAQYTLILLSISLIDRNYVDETNNPILFGEMIFDMEHDCRLLLQHLGVKPLPINTHSLLAQCARQYSWLMIDGVRI